MSSEPNDPESVPEDGGDKTGGSSPAEQAEDEQERQLQTGQESPS